MALVKSKIMIENAQKGDYAIGAFNIENMEMAQGVILAAEEMRSPVICAVSQNSLKYASQDMYYSIVSTIVKDVSIPVALHIDHAENEEIVQKALCAGFTSVMIDGSDLSFGENSAITKKIVKICRKYGVPVEGELGSIGGKNDTYLNPELAYTDPQAAVAFVEETNIDFLAVAIGTIHGVYRDVPKLDYDRLAEIKRIVKVPLVLHGASGLSNEQISRCISLGVSKVNIATELRIEYTRAIKDYLTENKNTFDPRRYGEEGRKAVKEIVKEKIKILGSFGKC